MDTSDAAMEFGLSQSASTIVDYSREANLVSGCIRREVGAFEELYKRHGSRLKSVAYQVLGNRQEAEDVVQETFLKAHRSIHGFKGEASLGTWLYRIAINVCRDVIRKRKPETEFTIVHGKSTQSPALRVALESMIQRLSPNHRMVFLLFAVEGMKHSEIAAVLDIPEGTSKAWLFEAKKELQRMLEARR